MRYLINSLQADENDYSDQLNPFKNEVGKSLMGEHRMMEPATTGDVRTMGEAILNRLDAVVTMPAHISSIRPVPTPTHVVPPVTSLITSPASRIAVTATAQHAQDGPAAPPPITSEPPAEHGEDPVIPGVCIPDLAIGEWKKAVDQWHRGDPAAGFKPLKDWAPQEYRGRMRKLVASKRRTRELIAMAYER